MFQHQVNFWPRAAGGKRGNFRNKKQRSLDVHDVRHQAQLSSVEKYISPPKNKAQLSSVTSHPCSGSRYLGVIYNEMLQNAIFRQKVGGKALPLLS